MSRAKNGAQHRAVRARREGPAGRVLAVAYVLAGLALTTAMAWPLYETPALVVVAAVAGASGAAIALVARLRRWPLWLTAVVVAGVYLVEVVPLAVPAGLRSPLAFLTGLRDGVIGVVVGWKQLLTLETPVGDYQAVLVPFFALALIGTVVATSLALHPGRRGALAVPVVLAGGVFGVAFAATDPGRPMSLLGVSIPAPREVGIGLLLVGLSLAWLIVRARLERRAALAEATSTTAVRSGRVRTAGVSIRRRLLAAGLLAVALVVGIVAVPVFADVAPRTTLRTGVEPLLVIRDVRTPLGTYRGSFQADRFAAPLFTVSGDTKGIDRIGMATLDEWDGREFRVGSGVDGSRFTRLPAGSAGAGARPIEIAIDDGFSGIWMPLPAGVRSAPQFTGPRADELADGFFLDRTSGAAVEIAGAGADRGLRPGDGYRVDVAPLATPRLGEPDGADKIDLQTSPQLAAWLDVQAQPRTAGGLAELLSRLRDRGYLSHSLERDAAAAPWIAALSGQAPYGFQSSYAGHGTSRLEELFRQLVEQESRVGAVAARDLLVAGIGDDEQFAAAGALVARGLGYDSRVVVGVRLAPLLGSGVPACTETCTGGNLAAWIEVRGPTDTEWTTFDVEPQFSQQPTLVSLGQELPKNPTVPEQAQVDTAQPPTSQRDDGSTGAAATEATAEWIVALLAVLRVVGLSLALVALLLLPFLVLLIAQRARRRSRRQAAHPEVAMVGAWEELVDTSADFGVFPHGRTRRDQAAASGSVLAQELAALVDAAVFAAGPPTRDAVDRAWALVDEYRAELRVSRGRWRGILAAVTPASFLRRIVVSDARGTRAGIRPGIWSAFRRRERES